MNIKSTAPGKELYNSIRASFILNDTTLGEWCKENNIKQVNAKSCLFGIWDGPKGQQLRKRIIKASNIEILTLNAA